MKSKNIYSLPFEKNTIFIAGSDPTVHYSHWKHAVDFLIDFNVPIVAPMDGVIWNVKDDSNEGGDDDKYIDWKYQNLITIKHQNDEYSQYVHLAHKSSLVKIGDKIKRGDLIAKGIGMVGCTTAPHLHMMVFFVKDKVKDDYKSLEIKFDKKIKIIRKTDEYNKELSKPKYKTLKELGEKYHSE
ncbi:MAG: M23 family metallopeptidase [Nanoarchaeota archaeon]|nr:M23 family metallopeptidase [Nanoarchaeota archaeon]